MLEENEKIKSSNLTSTQNIVYFVVALLLILSFYYPAKPSEMMAFNGFTITMLLIIIGMALTSGSIAIIKYRSPHLNTFSVHGSTSGDPIESAGIWEAYTLGDLYVLSPLLKGKEGTVIVPKSHVSKQGRNINIPCWTEVTPPNKIPWDIQPIILRNEKCKQPFHVCWFSPKIKHDIAHASYLKEQVKSLSSELKMKDEMLNDERLATLRKWEEFRDTTSARDRDMIKEASKKDKFKSFFGND